MIVTGSPLTAFCDAFQAVLAGDAALGALVEGVFGHLRESERTAYPYLVIGRTSRDNSSGAMQVAGGRVTLQLDGWSDANGPHEMERILSRVAALMERRHPFLVAGFEVVVGSLTCELEEVFDEPDDDSPDRRLYHGVQRWACEVHGA